MDGSRRSVMKQGTSLYAFSLTHLANITVKYLGDVSCNPSFFQLWALPSCPPLLLLMTHRSPVSSLRDKTLLLFPLAFYLLQSRTSQFSLYSSSLWDSCYSPVYFMWIMEQTPSNFPLKYSLKPSQSRKLFLWGFFFCRLLNKIRFENHLLMTQRTFLKRNVILKDIFLVCDAQTELITLTK